MSGNCLERKKHRLGAKWSENEARAGAGRGRGGSIDEINQRSHREWQIWGAQIAEGEVWRMIQWCVFGGGGGIKGAVTEGDWGGIGPQGGFLQVI